MLTLTIESINKMFIGERFRSTRSWAVTEPIPIAFFNAHEKEIRDLGCNVDGYRNFRSIYRGPRRYAEASMTLREDATHVRMYRK